MTKHLVVSALAGWWVTSAAWAHGPGHPGEYGTALSAPTLARGLELAAGEAKLVCLYVTDRSDRSLQFLHWRTDRTDDLLDLVMLECVIVEQSLTEHAEALAGYDLPELPALLLLDNSGSEVQRYTGDLTTARLQRALTAEFGNDATLARVQRAVELKGANHLFTRDRLARVFMRRGQCAEALAQFRYTVDQCITEPSLAARARRPRIFLGLADLARVYPPAQTALDEMRSRVEGLLRAGQDNGDLAHDLAHLNEYLDESARSLALHDELPADSNAQSGIFEHVFDDLVALQRYEDALAHVDPLTVFRGELAWAKQRAVQRAAAPDVPRGRGSRAYVLATGAALLEATAGAGRADDARTLIDEILTYDNRPATIALLRQHLQRAGAGDLVGELEMREEVQR